MTQFTAVNKDQTLKNVEMRLGIVKLLFKFMVGQACAMLGAASWQILASVLKMPVSGTHSIVGAVLGSR